MKFTGENGFEIIKTSFEYNYYHNMNNNGLKVAAKSVISTMKYHSPLEQVAICPLLRIRCVTCHPLRLYAF